MNHNGDNEDWFEEIPMMFRAQAVGRCQVQKIEKGKQQDVHDWANEWTKMYPKPTVEKPQTPDKNLPVWKRSSAQPQPKISHTPPQFANTVVARNYTLSWRLVTNSGQDETIIRPVIGAKGYPHYPGSSMKGAFSRACETKEQRERYCGKALSEVELARLPAGSPATKPGILRFHGGYPVDTSWTQNLVDLVHPQAKKQVMDGSTEGAKVQISLHNVKMRFGISSPKLDKNDPEWETIWKIWEKALQEGIGSRVSAGYGRFEGKDSERSLLTIHLRGKGLASTLLKGTPELRPNMFKAALRGHTLRLLGGMTDADTAIKLTQKLWGGIEGEDRAIVGLLGVAFQCKDDPEKLFEIHQYQVGDKTPEMWIYDLKKGLLNLFCSHRNLTDAQQDELQDLAKALIQFSMLFGGFGKSWRRVNHSLFYSSYLGDGEIKKKPAIGCHWKFNQPSQSLYLPMGEELAEIAQFIDKTRDRIRVWASQQGDLGNTVASQWREAWYKDSAQQRGVQVWGRIATKGSLAIKWFHQENRLKNTTLGGGMQRTGRIWHRMYPRYVVNRQGDLEDTKQYVELLTIFPDNTDESRNFIRFLQNSSSQPGNFQHLW